MLAASSVLGAQELAVSGTVLDEQGMEAIGVSIHVKDSPKINTVTDLDGKYSIKVPSAKKSVLVFQYVGMVPLEVKVDGKNTIDVKLQPNNNVLDEVVVVGYGTMRRGDLTGSVVSVKGSELQTMPTSDPLQALAGRVAGVRITQSEGEPGAAISVRVRGGISITQSNEPLYVIDGFPSENGLQDLDPAEIESIDVLKDASSTAIYGARGANGVVVVTTKKGSGDSKFQVSFDMYAGFRKLARKLDVLDAFEYLNLDYERSLVFKGESGVLSFQNRYGSFADIAENYADRPGLDWQEEALGGARSTQNYHLGLSGGGKDLKYNFNYSYSRDEGAMILSGSDKHVVSLSVNHKAAKWITLNARMNFNEMKVWGMGTSELSTRFNKLEHILQYRPTVGLYGEDSSLLTGDDMLMNDDDDPMQSPIISANEEDREKLTRTFQVNGGFTLTLSGHVSFRNNTGYRYRMQRQEQFNGEKSVSGKRSSINGSIQYNGSTQFQTSNTITYDNRHKVHKLSVMLGQEYIDNRVKWLATRIAEFPNNDIGLGDASLGTPQSVTSGINFDDKILSFFGRVNYNYRDRYLLTATFRADGSSKFSKKNKWGYFPSVSAAWRLVEEPFIQRLGVFSDLKLRAGYGLAGNNRIPSYRSLEILTSAGYPQGDSFVPGYAPNAIRSEDLKWESNATFNAGLDLGFFNQRLAVSPEFFYNRSSNLLLNSRVPTSSGFKNMLRNVGRTSNRGFDISLTSYNIVTRNFEWTTNFNISFNRNRIDELSGEKYFLEEGLSGEKTHKIEVGKSIGQIYGYKTVGLYRVEDFDYDAASGSYTLKEGLPVPTYVTDLRPGHWKFQDTDGNGEINDNDKTVIGNATPVCFGGFNNTFRYRDFDLNVFFTYSIGGDVLNGTKIYNSKAGKTNYNVLSCMDSSHRFTYIDKAGNLITDPATLAAVNAGRGTASVYDSESGDSYIQSWAVEDASFLRLSNLSLGYTVPSRLTRRIHIDRLRFYFTASNLFVITKYSGYDPEVSTVSNSLTPGIDFGGYPRSRSYVFGLNLSF